MEQKPKEYGLMNYTKEQNHSVNLSDAFVERRRRGDAGAKPDSLNIQ